MVKKYLGKAVSSGHHLEATEHSCFCRSLLCICLSVGVEGLPWQTGLAPGVLGGQGVILLAVACPEHALRHIAATELSLISHIPTTHTAGIWVVSFA